jgi:hypothetical protein
MQIHSYKLTRTLRGKDAAVEFLESCNMKYLTPVTLS